MPLIPDTRPGLIQTAAVLSLAFWSSAGLAQDTIVVGAGAIYAPAYQGADNYRALPVPMIDVTWGPMFANFRDGIGVKAIDTGTVTAGIGVTFMPGYRRKDAPAGIGRLTAGAGGRAFVSMNAAGFTATIGATKGFAGNTRGLIADVSLSYPIIVSRRLMLIPVIEATWADAKHNDRYFGVDATQSVASGLRQFRAGSGFKDASALLNLQYRLTDRISLGVSGGATTLLGKVQDSPIVFHKTQALGFFSLSYRFGS